MVHAPYRYFVLLWLLAAPNGLAEDLLRLDNGVVQIGIDRDKGAAITWLAWQGYPQNVVNIADPGRLIQQSYYAGKSLNRQAEGQHAAWSPWTWNPIQGGGVGSWSRVTAARIRDVPDPEAGKTDTGPVLFSETIPNLWDMPEEPAAATMRQWTAFEPSMPNVIVVRCEFVSQREPGDRWGVPLRRHQEIPACYFTRNFHVVKSYLGNARWRDETQPPGPPWGTAIPPRKAMVCLNDQGQGIAVFSPAATTAWNFGPHGKGRSDDPVGGPCLHVAPLDTVALHPRSTYRYRYWLVVGSEAEIATRLDALWEKYADETTEHLTP